MAPRTELRYTAAMSLPLAQHRDLVHMLVARNLKIRYKGSALGFLWSLLTPLAMIAIYAVFAGVLGMRRELLGLSGDSFDYLPFLVAGIVAWQFTAGVLGDSLHAIAGNSNLVKKVYFPRVILPVTTVLANAVNFLLTFAVLLVYLAAAGALRLSAATLWLVPALVLQLALCLGIAMLVATLQVFFRDTEHIVGLVQLAWFFTTPIMYEASLQTTALARFAWFPEGLRGLVFLNPMTGILALYRRALMGMDFAPPGVCPYWLALSVATIAALFLLGRAALRAGDRRFGDVL